MYRVHGSYTGLQHEMLSHRTASFTMPETTFCLHDTDFESIGTVVLATIGICQNCLVKLRLIECMGKLSGPFAGELIVHPASSVVKAGSKSLIDGVSSCKADEEGPTGPSLASSDFASIRPSTAASSAVNSKAEH